MTDKSKTTIKGKGKAKLIPQVEQEDLSSDGGSFSLGSEDSSSDKDSVSSEYSSDSVQDESQEDEVLELLKESEDAGQSEYQTGLRSGKMKHQLEIEKSGNKEDGYQGSSKSSIKKQKQ